MVDERIAVRRSVGGGISSILLAYLSLREGSKILSCGVLSPGHVETFGAAGCAVRELEERPTAAGGAEGAPTGECLAEGAEAYDAIIHGSSGRYARRPGRGGRIGTIRRTAARLSDRGVMIVGFENGPRQLWEKLTVGWHLARVGLRDLEWLVLLDSFREPRDLLPLSCSMRHIRAPFDPSTQSIRGLAKAAMKRAFAVLPPWLNPLVGTAVVARRREKPRPQTVNEAILSLAGVDRDTGYVVWHAKTHSVKRVGLVYRKGQGRGGRLVAVAKVGSAGDGGGMKIRGEYQRLLQLDALARDLEGIRVLAPRPVSIGAFGGLHVSLESGLTGTSISDRYEEVSARKLDERVSQVLFGVLERQRQLQEVLTRRLLSTASCVDKSVFYDGSEFNFPWYQDGARFADYDRFVQHGDYTTVNLLVAENEESLGVIDWEWMGKGFPPGFDVFHLLISLGYRGTRVRGEGEFEKQRRSFVETFFESNPMNTMLAQSVRASIAGVGGDGGRCFEYFMDFLLFHYNKYRRQYGSREYAELYRGFVHYAMHNRTAFVAREGEEAGGMEFSNGAPGSGKQRERVPVVES